MRQENILISFLQAYGISLVVIGHSFYALGNQGIVHEWIYNFHMPLFMAISGYLLCYGLRRKGTTLCDIDLKHFLWRKVNRLLFPYVVISSLAYVPKMWLGNMAARPAVASWGGYWEALLYPWENPIVFFWFLPTLFLIFVIVTGGGRILRPVRGRYLWSVVLLGAALLHLFNPCQGVAWLNLEGVMNYLLFFLVGYAACHYEVEKYMEHHVKWWTATTLALSVLAVAIPDFWSKGVWAALNGMALSLCLALLYRQAKGSFLNPLFGASFTIYLLSWFPQVLSQQVLLALFPETPWPVPMTLAIVTGITIPLIIHKWVMAHREQGVGRLAAKCLGM